MAPGTGGDVNEILNRMANAVRVAGGRPARNMSDREFDRRVHRAEAARRRAADELTELARLAREYDLPMPIEPTRVVAGFIVHGRSQG